MNIIKRLKTLWKLSGIEDLDLVEPPGFKWTGFIKVNNQKAQIVDMENPIESLNLD